MQSTETLGRKPGLGAMVGAAVVGLASLFWFGNDLGSQPFFADESADIAQSYYFRVAIARDWNHIDWLHPAAYDHTPVFKYLIGLSLRLAGQRVPETIADWERWMQGDFSAPTNDAVLRSARVPMMLGAVLGCVMVYWLAAQLAGIQAGLIAAVLLAASPLYFTHARRAMADDLTQALVVAGLVSIIAIANALTGPIRWRRFLLLAMLGGIACGLAPATKLNGATAALTIAVWIAMAILGVAATAVTSGPFARKTNANGNAIWKQLGLSLVAGAIMAVVSVALFIGINPFFYARPNVPEITSQTMQVAGHQRTAAWLQEVRRLNRMGVVDRARYMLEHRTQGLIDAQQKFEDDALIGLGPRLRAIVQEGMGRWTVFGWLPMTVSVRWVLPLLLVLIGLRFALRDGAVQLRSSRMPVAWILLAWPAIEIAMLCKSLALNWDRYYMGVTTWTSLLCAYAVAGVLKRFWDRIVLEPPMDADEK